MHFLLKTSFGRIFNGPAPILVAACVVVAMGSLPGHATLTDPAPAAWTVVDGTGNPEDQNNWLPYQFNGESLYDSEGGLSTDSSNGGASFSGAQDIASAYPPIAGPGCTTVGDTQCGDEISAFFFYYDAGLSGVTGDVLFLRLRVNGDPRSTPGFDGGHWNFLLDVQQGDPPALDGYKELWIDVNGNYNGGAKADTVRLLYEDNDDDDVTNDDGAYGTLTGADTCGGLSASGGTVINSFVACSAEGLGGNCQDGSGQDLSHTRIVDIGDGTGEFFVDVMIRMTDLKDNDGCYSYPKKFTDPEVLVEGTQVVTDPTQFTLLYSTSNSATDPMQKDFVAHDFGDPASTPVTLASFSSLAEGGRVHFEWTTSTETSNVGFDIYEFTGDRWQQVNKRLIPSKTVNSTTPQHYSFEVEGSTGSLFKIVDLSTDIRSRKHGPFELDRAYGRPATAEPIDWAAIRQEHRAKARARRISATAAVQKSLAARATETYSEKRLGPSGGPVAVCNLEVSETGLYRVTTTQLAEAGCSLDGLRPRFVALTNRGESVPIRVVAPGRTFGSESYIEFYGVAGDSPYTSTNVYQLVFAARLAERVKVDRRSPLSQSEAPAVYAENLLVDQNRAYHFMSPTGDPWYDTMMLAFADEPLAVDFPLHVDSLGAGAATLHVGLWGVTNWPDNPDHHVQVLLNGSLVWDENFDGLTKVPLSIELPDGLLHEGENSLTLVLPGDTGVRFDMVNLDTYGVDYPRAFLARNGRLTFEADAQVIEVGGLPSEEVVVYRTMASKKNSGLWLVGKTEISSSGGEITARFAGDPGGEARYFVAAVDSLLTPVMTPARKPIDIMSGLAEYLVISHSDFLGGLASLIDAREAQGRQARVVDVDDVFASFSSGNFDPSAIRDYIAYAAANMGTRAVLLVGGDTFDYKDYLGVGSLSFIPTLYTNTGSGATFTPTDALLADGDGDLLPDVAIGRLPVRSSAELAAIVAKILAYEAGGHHNTGVFVADDSEPGTPFTETSIELINELPGSWHVTRAHIDESGEAGARTALLTALDEGVALTSFVGHSGPNRWTYNGLFDSEDVGLLNNEGVPTVVSQWGCWNTYFVEPEVNTMAHAFMLSEGGGAAAVFGAATITTFREDDAFAALLQRHLTTPGKPIGEAILDAKRELAETYPGMLEVILGLNLLGDPAMVLAP